MVSRETLIRRRLYLILGVISLVFAGVVYAWSILKAPLAAEFAWSGSQLALNFTLTMCFFCLGVFAGGLLAGRAGPRLSLLGAAVLSGLGFLLTSLLTASRLPLLYVSYGGLAGFGIGVAYNAIVSTVSAWFPDKKGFCSGALMMGFGASALLIGNLAARLIEGPGWRFTYRAIGLTLAAVLAAAAFLLKRPGADETLPAAAAKGSSSGENFEAEDVPTAQMLRRLSFWKAFLCIAFLAAVGNTVFSFARDLALSVGAGAALATTLVGVLSVCNGLGRIAFGALFDRLGRKKTMLSANLCAIAAAGITLISVQLVSLPLGILGLCLTGFSYGASPTICSAITSAFYGTKYFPVNFSAMNFNLMLASFMATAASALLEATGAYVAPFLFLLGLAVLSLLLNLSIKRP